MKTKIKNLKHARELYESGVLVPMKTILVDEENRERIFLGFIRNFEFLVTESTILQGTVIWDTCKISNKEFHIKPKTETKTVKSLKNTSHKGIYMSDILNWYVTFPLLIGSLALAIYTLFI